MPLLHLTSDPRTLVVRALDGSSVGNLWRSEDGGATWRSLQPGLGVESRDGGRSWSGPRTLQTAHALAGGGDRLLAAGGANGDRPLGLFASSDAGRTFARRDAGIITGDARYALIAQRRANGGRRLILLDGTPSTGPTNVFASNGGVGWSRLPVAVPYGLAAAGEHALVALASELDFSRTAVVRSSDSGSSWTEVVPRPVPADASPIHLRPASHGGSVMLSAFTDEGSYGTIVTRLSDDGGASWRDADEGLPLACVHGCSLGACPSIAAYEADPFVPARRYVAVALRGPGAGSDFDTDVYRSDDSGATWQLAGALPRGLPTYVLGVETNLYALHADPTRPDRVLAGTIEGVWESLDAGASWHRLGTGLGNAPDPYAPVSQLLRETDAPIWYAATYQDGIWRSADDGATWTPLAGQPDREQPTLALDPRGGLLAAFRSLGIWRWTP